VKRRALLLVAVLLLWTARPAHAQEAEKNVLFGLGAIMVGILAAGGTALVIVEGVTWKDARPARINDLPEHWVIGTLGTLGGALALGGGIASYGGVGNERWSPALISIGSLALVSGTAVIALGIRRVRLGRRPPVSLWMSPTAAPGGTGLLLGGRW
jgi:hypothetical protein